MVHLIQVPSGGKALPEELSVFVDKVRTGKDFIGLIARISPLSCCHLNHGSERERLGLPLDGWQQPG